MKSSKQKISKTGLVGGSFNPPHIGHLRLCVEILEQTGLDMVQLVPAYIPPHKNIKNILPFDMRCSMIEAAIEGFPGISVNYLEKERSGPSYTFDTLQALINDEPDKNFVFIMGDSDLLTMPKWYKGREIAFLSELIIVNRESDDEKKLDEFISSYWEAQKSAQGVWQVIQGKKISFFPIPRIDISSSMVRSRWMAGKDIQWLVSDQVKKYLNFYTDEVRAVWSK